MAVIDVVLHLRATVEVADDQALPVRMRIQEALERITDPLLELRAAFEPDMDLRATVRAAGAEEGTSNA